MQGFGLPLLNKNTSLLQLYLTAGVPDLWHYKDSPLHSTHKQCISRKYLHLILFVYMGSSETHITYGVHIGWFMQFDLQFVSFEVNEVIEYYLDLVTMQYIHYQNLLLCPMH